MSEKKKQTFAQWEKDLKEARPGIRIFTSCNEKGEVTVAWSAGGETWHLRDNSPETT